MPYFLQWNIQNCNDIVVVDDYNYDGVDDNNEDNDGDVHDVVRLSHVNVVDHDADGCL